MKLDLERLLEKCEKGHWSVDDFDWSQKSSLAMTPEEEVRICQHFLNLSYIERMAGALFLSLSNRMTDPTVKAIYANFHRDEIRHSQAMARLVDYFDVHHYKTYTPSRPMLAFIPYFTGTLDTLNPSFANHAVTLGELFLDIALLRAVNDYVDDPLSRAIIENVNRDESRHVTMDFYMTEYCSEHIVKANQGGKRRGPINLDLLGTQFWAEGFLTEVFLGPMQYLDADRSRQREAIHRIVRLYRKPEVAANPAVRAFNGMIAGTRSPLGRKRAELVFALVKIVSGIDLTYLLDFALEEPTDSKSGRGGRGQSAVEMAREIFEN